MIFRSKFLDHVPFSTLSAKRYSEPVLSGIALAEDRLTKKWVGVERVKYRGGNDKIFDTQTGHLFSGIVHYDCGDKFERILRIKDGNEVFSLIRTKNGKPFQAEIVDGHVKKFKTDISPEEIEAIEEADKGFWKQMKKNFLNRGFIKINK